jgi:hypothetical protein
MLSLKLSRVCIVPLLAVAALLSACPAGSSRQALAGDADKEGDMLFSRNATVKSMSSANTSTNNAPMAATIDAAQPQQFETATFALG